MKRAADNSIPHVPNPNAHSARFIEDRLRIAAQRFAQRERDKNSVDATEAAIDTLITNYPDCPRWASRAVDQLMVQQEFLAQSSQELF